jgi:hypothetical protein
LQVEGLVIRGDPCIADPGHPSLLSVMVYRNLLHEGLMPIDSQMNFCTRQGSQKGEKALPCAMVIKEAFCGHLSNSMASTIR